MRRLKQFEETIESMVEGSLAQAMTGHLQPVEIAKKLARAMDSGQTIAADKTLVPNEYVVSMHPVDFAALAPFRLSLERELAAHLRSLAEERGLGFVAPPRVTLHEDSVVRPRRMRIEASLADAAAPAAHSMQAQFTAALPVAQVQAHLDRSARLIFAADRSVSLDKPVLSVGRQIDNDIVIEDKRVSRHHAQLRFEHNSYVLYDLASANGTLVNDAAIEQVVLHDGDRISFGGVEVSFQRKLREARRGA
jgi:hypothetical protein